MKTFEDLFSELQHKADTRPEGSGTVEELDRGVHFIAKGYSLQDVYRYL